MTRVTLLCLALPVVLFACAEGATEIVRPPEVLPPAQMAALLRQAHTQEALLQSRRLDAPSAKALFDKSWDSTCRAQGTDTATFGKSFAWYARHVSELDAVYAQVVDSLGLDESKAAGLQGPAPTAAPQPGR